MVENSYFRLFLVQRKEDIIGSFPVTFFGRNVGFILTYCEREVKCYLCKCYTLTLGNLLDRVPCKCQMRKLGCRCIFLSIDVYTKVKETLP